MTGVQQAAERLRAADRRRSPGLPIRELIGDTDIARAYEVQQLVTRGKLASGAKLIGRKIGLTSLAVQQQVGVDTPDFGVLLDDMLYRSGQSIPIDRLLQPRAEAEIAFVLSDDILEADLSLDELARSVAYATPAIEVVDSRISDWDIRITDTIGDNASSGVFVLGDERVSLDSFEPRDVTMHMTSNGLDVSTGSGAACLGDPLEALRWLARTSIAFGSPLRAGEIILSGALGPLAPVEAGQTLVASISTLGSVTITFSHGESS